jgi:hypothetical protein
MDKRHYTPVLLAGLLMAQVSTADSYRCGRKIVRNGDTKAELLRLCGEPRFRDRGVEIVKIDGNRKNARVERWYYRKSSRSLGRVILVYRGRIAGIEVEGR